MDLSKVNYTYYSNTLGRAVIPTEADFEAHKLENIQYIKSLDPYLEELETDGAAKACCLCIEVDYKIALLTSGGTSAAIASESLGGHSVSYGSQMQAAQIAKDSKSKEEYKITMIKLFNRLKVGVI